MWSLRFSNQSRLASEADVIRLRPSASVNGDTDLSRTAPLKSQWHSPRNPSNVNIETNTSSSITHTFSTADISLTFQARDKLNKMVATHCVKWRKNQTAAVGTGGAYEPILFGWLYKHRTPGNVRFSALENNWISGRHSYTFSGGCETVWSKGLWGKTFKCGLIYF